MFSKEELERYNRHILLPEIGLSGQEKLKQARVLVIGAGGLGCPVLQYLTAAGVGQIGICDFDYIDASNLQRQILYTYTDIGKPKAETAARRLSQINPFVDFSIHNQMLNKENVLDIFSRYDIIVDGTDNFPTRFLINDASVILGKPLIYGAIYKFEGQVSVFNYQGGPTYRCLVPEEPSAQEAPNCSQIGVIGAMPGLVACYQAMETIKLISGSGKILSGQVLLIDALNLTHNYITVKRNDTTANIKKLGTYGDFCKSQYPDIRQLSPEDLVKYLQDSKVTIIDIRQPEIFKQYHLESVNIPIESLLTDFSQIERNIMTVLVCEVGTNSQAVIDFLTKQEFFENLYNLDGGIQAWIKKGLPLIS